MPKKITPSTATTPDAVDPTGEILKKIGTPPEAIDDPHGVLKRYAPESGLGKLFAFVDGDGESRSAADRASDGILGDLISKALDEKARQIDAEVAAATTPEKMAASFQKILERARAEGLLDKNGHPKPSDASGPERFINKEEGKDRGK